MPRSNVKRVRPSMVFARKSGNDVIGCATAAAQGVLTNPAVFPTPPVDGQTLSAQIAAYGTAYNAFTADGRKKARADKHKQRHVLIEMLRKVAHYAEGACNRDMPTFLLSGFQPVYHRSSPAAGSGSAVHRFDRAWGFRQADRHAYSGFEGEGLRTPLGRLRCRRSANVMVDLNARKRQARNGE